MPAVVGVPNHGGGGTILSRTWQHNVTGTDPNRALIIVVYYGDGGEPVAECSVDGVPIDFVGIAVNPSSHNWGCAAYIITGVATGLRDCYVELEAAAEMWAVSFEVADVHQVSPIRPDSVREAFGNTSGSQGLDRTLSVPSEIGDLIFSALGVNSIPHTAQPPLNAILSEDNSDFQAAATAPGAAGSTDVTWRADETTSIGGGHVAFALQPPSGGGDPDPETVTPDRVDAAAAVAAPTVAATPAAVQPLPIDALAEVLGAALVAAGIITPARISASATIGAPSVQASSQTLQPARVEASAELAAPAVRAAEVIAAGVTEASAVVQQPAVAATSVAVQPSTIEATAATHQPTISEGVPAGVVGPQRIAAAASVRAPVVAAEPVSVQPERVEAAAIVRDPDVSAGVLGVTVRPARVELAAVVHEGVLEPGSATIAIERVDVDAAIGEAVVQVTPAMIVVERIDVPAEVYAASVIGGPGVVVAEMVEAGASVGDVLVLRGGLEPLERVERTLFVRSGIARNLVVVSSVERTLTVVDRIECTLEV